MSPEPRVVPVNRLLALLKASERQKFLANCDEVELTFGSVLYEQGARIRHVYFPISGFISMLATVDDDSTLEVGMVGNEGMCGYNLVLGGSTSALRALTQGAGGAWRMETAKFRRAIEAMPSLRIVLHRYLHVLMRQLAQTAACARFHVLETRLARWLLMTCDRAHAESFPVTQEFLAFMLGVRRVGVTAAAGTLQARDLIRYSRGHITILNRERLEAAACSCYHADVESYLQELGTRMKR